MNTLRMALAGLVVTAAVVVAAGPPAARPAPPVDRESLNDQLDYLFLASDRPVMIRLHLRLGDKPYAQGWSAWMDKMFGWFDKNNNGHLEASEVARLPTVQPLTFHLQGSIGGFFGNQTIPLGTLDANKDNKVSREELRAYYRKNGLGALRFSQSNYQATEAEKLNKAIFARVNKKRDGKLTQADAARFPELLARLDENEDELLAVGEVNTRVDVGFYAQPVTVGTRPAVSLDYGLIDVKSTGQPEVITKLVRAYDRNKDGQLGAGEIGLDKADFAALDKDGNGQLSREELGGYVKRRPDLTLRARVGALGTTKTVLGELSRLFGQKSVPGRAELLNSGKQRSPLAGKVKRVNGDNLSLSLGDADVSIQVNQGSANRNGTKQFYLRQFDSAANKKESIERKQVMNDPYIGQLFTQADKNADGKLTKKELIAWLDLLGEGGGTFVNLTLNDLGRSVFQAVDANRDNQLSTRELRTAWDRIKPLCRDKDKAFLRTEDMRRGLTVTMQQGFNNFGAPQAVSFFPGGPSRPAGRPANAPLWFRKMDRNYDGDITPKEWLGTEEDFREVDTDGDGLISPAEARAFDARTKKEAARKEEAAAKEAKRAAEKK